MPNTSALLYASLVSSLALPQAEPTEPPEAALSLELALAARISEQRALAHVRTLVEFGPRMGGTRSGEAAAEWLAERFLSAGLDVRRVEDPARPCHEETSFRVVAHLQATDADEPLELVLDHAWPYGYSPSAEGRRPLGLEPDANKVMLTDRLPRRPGWAGIALLLVDGANTADGRWPVPRALPARDSNPFPVFGISRPEGESLRRALAEGRVVEIEYELVSHVREASPRTIIARIPAAKGSPPGHLLFSAHGDSDSGGPGANDNASGEAILLEIASAWSAAIEAGQLKAPRREVRFAIWGSEIHSSRAYLRAAIEQEQENPLLAVINYDQAGFGSGSDQLNIEPDDLQANAGLVRIFASVLEDHSGHEGFPELWATNGSLGGTDSYVFSRAPLFRSKLRPSLTLFTSAWDEARELPRTPGMPGESWSERDRVGLDYDLHYHSAGDTPENTVEREPFNMAWCARVGLLGALRWLGSLDSPVSDR